MLTIFVGTSWKFLKCRPNSSHCPPQQPQQPHYVTTGHFVENRNPGLTITIKGFETVKIILTDKWPYHGLEHFLVHRPHFWGVFVTRGLDSSLRDLIRPFVIIQDRISWQKPTPDEDLRVKYRARIHISKVSYVVRRGSVGENRSKTGPRGRNND